jgi:hypothetical protein
MDLMPEVIETEPEINEEEEIKLDDEDDFDSQIVEEKKIPQIKKEDIFFREGEVEPIPKPKRKKRPPMSEEHKKKLAEARVKALETRRRNSQEKKELKELEKKKKQIEKQRLKDFVEGKETKQIETPPKVMKVVEEPKPEPIKEPIKETPKPVKTREYITRQELEESNLKAILAYEAIRKQRKQEKQKKQHEEKQVEQVRQKIQRAMPDTKAYYGRDLREDYFNNCF